MTSGSTAAFEITVVPFARTAASSRFSVAPTLGNGSATWAPRRPSVFTCTHRTCSAISAPIARRPARWKSTGRFPIRHPPGSGTAASPTRCSNGPIIRIGMRFTPEYASDSEASEISGVATRTVCASSHSTWVPSSVSMSRTTSTSTIRGTLVSVHGSFVSNVATSSLVTEFFAPEAATEPVNGRPPTIRYRCRSVAIPVRGTPTGYLPQQ
jgi:hypothetical protein